MTKQWRIRITGKPRKEPDIALLVQAVLALGEQMQREVDERQAAQQELPEAPEATS
jgi:hypothetical protein